MRDEHALLAELLRVDRVALANFMAYAARTLARARSQLHRRTHEPEQFQDKLNRLHKLYSRLWRRAAALSLHSLAKLLETTVAALDVPRTGEARTGDALLPALVAIDAVFLALMSIAQRTGVPLAVRRRARRRPSRDWQGEHQRSARCPCRQPELAACHRAAAARRAALRGAGQAHPAHHDWPGTRARNAFRRFLRHAEPDAAKRDRARHRNPGAAPRRRQESPRDAAGRIPAPPGRPLGT